MFKFQIPTRIQAVFSLVPFCASYPGHIAEKGSSYVTVLMFRFTRPQSNYKKWLVLFISRVHTPHIREIVICFIVSAHIHSKAFFQILNARFCMRHVQDQEVVSLLKWVCVGKSNLYMVTTIINHLINSELVEYFSIWQEDVFNFPFHSTPLNQNNPQYGKQSNKH